MNAEPEPTAAREGGSPAPRNHFGEALILAHTVGAASDGAALAVACHLALCAVCRGLARDLDRIGESLLEPLPLPAGLRSKLLAEAGAPAPAPAPPRPLPPQLRETLTGVPAAALTALAALPRPRWHWLVPGIRAITLFERDGSVARLLRLGPGLVIPAHDHDGTEHTVIFAGGLDDERVRLDRGDALTMEPGDRHRQVAARREGCFALIVNEAPPRPLTLAGRILKRLARL
jgi:putative transcriptional regulator